MATTGRGALMSCVICGDKNLSPKCPGNNDVSVEKLNKVIQLLGVPSIPSEVRLCDECHSGVVKAEGWRAKAVEVDRVVRTLQCIILQTTIQLKWVQDSYLEEMRALHQKIRKPEEVPGPRNGEEISIGALASVKQEILDEDPGGFEDAVPEENDASAMESDADVSEFPSVNEEIDSRDHVEASLLPSAEEPFVAVKSLSTVEKVDTRPSVNDWAVPVIVSVASVSSASQTIKKKKKPAVRSPPCPLCGRTFPSKWHLKVHLYTHTGERPYQCQYCPRAFADRANLKRHVMTHTGKKPFNCPECGKGFIQKRYLTRHLETDHDVQNEASVPSAGRSDPCHFCGKTFVNKYNLKIHLYTHTGERPHKCHLCPLAFRTKGHLKRHLRTVDCGDSGEKSFICSECGQGFTTARSMKRHLKGKHSGNGSGPQE